MSEMQVLDQAGGYPDALAAGRDGTLWFTEAEDRIGRRTLDGQVTSFPAADHPGAAIGGLTIGPDGALWYTDLWETDSPTVPGESVTHRAVGRMASDGSTSQIQLPDDGWFPNLITTGPDGNLWVTEWAGNKVIRLTPAGQITEFAASGPLGIASGPDGNIWFTETNNSVIGRVNLD